MRMLSPVVCVVCVAGASLSSQGAVTYLTQARSVDARGGPGESVVDSSSAPGFGPFAGTATVNGAPTLTGSATATQTSSLDQSQMSNTSTVSVTAGNQFQRAWSGSHFLVTFSVTQPTPWTLSGGWTMSTLNGLTGPAFATARVTLLQDGSTLYDQAAPTPQPTVLAGAFGASGTFVPGSVYSLGIELTDTIQSLGGRVATADLNATLSFVPAPSAAGLLGLAGLVAARRRR